MCGRYSFDVDLTDLMAYYNLPLEDQSYEPREQVFPTNEAPVLLSDGKVHLLNWGFTPAYGKHVLINARSETVQEKKTFQEAFERRRCVIFSDGFYEWDRSTTPSTRYHITNTEEPYLAMAGIWQPQDGGGQFVILTTESTMAMKGIHHRMPVILKREDLPLYLNHAQMPHAFWDVLRGQNNTHLRLVAQATGQEIQQIDFLGGQ